MALENSDPNLNQAADLKPLEVTKNGDTTVLISTIPSGFAIVENETFEGKKIIATRAFLKGELLYIGHAALLDLSAIRHKFTVQINSQDGEFLSKHQNDDTHSVEDFLLQNPSESKRQCYGWDGFMNHSCDANAYFPLLYRTPNEMCYRAIALRDIFVGDEVTCDYSLFDYHCTGHEIKVCACGSPKCRGEMLGFQGLDLRDKVDILHLVEREIKDKFMKDENVVIHKSHLPQGIGLVTNNSGTHLIATRRFGIGEPLFINRAELIPMDEVVDRKFCLEIDGKYALLDAEQHFIYRDGYAEMLGFDSFMDHSCEPNCEQQYLSKNEYVVRAKKPILAGDKITCDYMALENSAIGMENFGTSSFDCECGETNCKGFVVC